MNVVFWVILIVAAIFAAVVYSCAVVGGEADDEAERMFQEFLVHKEMYQKASGMESHKNDR